MSNGNGCIRCGASERRGEERKSIRKLFSNFPASYNGLPSCYARLRTFFPSSPHSFTITRTKHHDESQSTFFNFSRTKIQHIQQLSKFTYILRRRKTTTSKWAEKGVRKIRENSWRKQFTRRAKNNYFALRIFSVSLCIFCLLFPSQLLLKSERFLFLCENYFELFISFCRFTLFCWSSSFGACCVGMFFFPISTLTRCKNELTNLFRESEVSASSAYNIETTTKWSSVEEEKNV